MLEILRKFEDQQRELEEIRAQEGGRAGREGGDADADGPEAEAQRREREELEKRLADVDLGKPLCASTRLLSWLKKGRIVPRFPPT